MHPPQRRGPSPPARPPPTRSAAAAIRSSACWPSGSSESAWAASADTNASAQSALRGHGAGRGGAELGKAGLGWPPFLAPWLPSRAALACRGTPHSCIHAPQRSTAATAAARLVHAGWLGFAPPSCPQQAQHRAVAPRSKAHTRAAPAPAPASLTPRSHEEHPPQRLQVLQHLQLLEEVPALSGKSIWRTRKAKAGFFLARSSRVALAARRVRAGMGAGTCVRCMECGSSNMASTRQARHSPSSAAPLHHPPHAGQADRPILGQHALRNRQLQHR